MMSYSRIIIDNVFDNVMNVEQKNKKKAHDDKRCILVK